ncbi:hypothetical protein GCM10027445_37600 [Amycolatopsis endophytica]|uniref:MarR family transcriptional regulator n=1 Tax=Amycolatopsis endophytica TaxID=860233 RepID=A0A853B887_9PSEU|nr:hypothetical protein [Amycolatopsis endophytica]NYI90967.1 hypothetical protein [Amycolatopsis endophytica]
MTASTLTHRDAEFLKAVADGRVELTASSEPHVYVDGLSCCDQFGARLLIHAGLVRRVPGTGARIPARLTDAGREALL